ncbi:MAG: glycosyltransferase family 2 protein [Marinilabiliaceae bacterium]|nr:glycosyltransferase family 2 protein [Marinilabiliaceae bacterium]
MNGISAIIITKNEEKNIKRCLQSIDSIVDEIIIIDSGSTDLTKEISLSFKKVSFIYYEWQGYSKAKNYGNSLAKYDWILSIDADEEISSELNKSILSIKKNEDLKFYRFSRLTNYCGKWIKHCHWYPDYQIRLFNKNHAEWVGDSVHEKLHFKDDITVKTINGDCYHYTIYSIEDHLKKVNIYSSIWAKETYSKGKKYNSLLLLTKPLGSFLNSYIIHKGFLDGYYGFIISIISGISRFQRIAKLKNLYKTGNT